MSIYGKYFLFPASVSYVLECRLHFGVLNWKELIRNGRTIGLPLYLPMDLHLLDVTSYLFLHLFLFFLAELESFCCFPSENAVLPLDVTCNEYYHNFTTFRKFHNPFNNSGEKSTGFYCNAIFAQFYPAYFLQKFFEQDQEQITLSSFAGKGFLWNNWKNLTLRLKFFPCMFDLDSPG